MTDTAELAKRITEIRQNILAEMSDDDNPFKGTVINMREVRRKNQREGMRKYMEAKREQKVTKILETNRQLTDFEDAPEPTTWIFAGPAKDKAEA